MGTLNIILFYVLMLTSLVNFVASRYYYDTYSQSEEECIYYCDFETVLVEVFYDHHSDKKGSTRSLIKRVCEESAKFGDKITVHFNLIARVENTDNGPACDASENCEDEFKEACSYTVANDEKGFICCMYSSDDHTQCHTKYEVTEEKIKGCVEKGYNSDAGKRLLDSSNKKDNAELKGGSLPALVFNNEKYSECVDNAAYDDLLYMLCAIYGIYKPNPPC